jgi:hypothetical protein
MWFTPEIPELRRLRQEDHEFEGSLSQKKKKKWCTKTVLYCVTLTSSSPSFSTFKDFVITLDSFE